MTDTHNPNRLMVVDDDPGIIDLISEVARDLGYEVSAVTNRGELLQGLAETEPTVVTLDLSMPDIDGIEVLTLLAEQGSRARIMLSSGLDSRLIAKSREIGEARGLTMLEELPKPFDIMVLHDRLAAAMTADSSAITESELAAALAAGDLTVYLQPKVRLTPRDTMAVVGAEALVRWNHPRRGVLTPDAFIGLAEDTGLILDLSDYVFRETMRHLAAWLPAHPGLVAAVNLSAKSFNFQDLPRRLHAITGEQGVPPANVCIEVTEHTAMANVERSLEVMTRLRVKGFGLSLDDFGTGFSSLTYLYRMPFTELKVDRSFVSSLATSDEAMVIVRSTIDLAHNLGLAACAEGVEDEAALEKLLQFGADSAQGFLFSRPMPAAEFGRYLAEVQGPPARREVRGHQRP